MSWYQTTYGLVDEVGSAGPVEAYLTGGVEEMLRAARARPEEGVAAFLNARGTPVMAVAAAVLPHTAEVVAPPGPPVILLLISREYT